MAIGKPINKNNYYAKSQGLEAPAIDTVENTPNPQDVASSETLPQTDENVQEEQSDAPAEDVTVEEQPAPAKDTPQDSFRKIREAKTRAEVERDLYKKQLEEYARMQQQAQAPTLPEPVIDDNIDFSLDDDSLLEGKHAKRITNKIKSLEKKLKDQLNQNKQYADEAKIKAAFPDFDAVVSKENVDVLNYQYPEIAKMLSKENDLYSKAEAAYSVMKKYGIYKEISRKDDRINALKNTQRPRPVTSASPQQGDSPLSQANRFAHGLTEELKAQLRKEMAEARRRM